MEAALEASRVEAAIELTQDDVLHGLQRMPERRLGSAVVSMVAALVVGVAGVVEGFDAPILMAMAFSVVLVVIMFLVCPRRAARQYFADIPADRRELAYVFTPVAFEISTKHSHVRQDYRALKQYVISPHTLLLYATSNIAQIVPLRAFEAADRERVLGWVKAQVPPAPKRSSKLKRTLILWGVLVVAFGLIWWFLNP